MLAALWAGKLMGLSGARLTTYAVEVHLADFDRPGDADIVGKITTDLNRAGVLLCPTEVRSRLSAFHRDALTQPT